MRSNPNEQEEQSVHIITYILYILRGTYYKQLYIRLGGHVLEDYEDEKAFKVAAASGSVV